MDELIRDTAFGQIIRLVSGRRLLPYDDELITADWSKYVHKEKSGFMAKHGQPFPPEGQQNDFTRELKAEQDEEATLQGDQNKTTRTPSRTTSDPSQNSGATVNDISGVEIDADLGKDSYVVDWTGPDDPDARHIPLV